MSNFEPRRLFELDVSAASGLCYLNKRFYVISDDELTLSIYDQEGRSETHALLPGSLPEEKKPRKKLKPDFESLMATSSGLLAIPSGSRPNRGQAVEIILDESGGFREKKVFSLQNIYQHLLRHFAELNIEGSLLRDNQLYLFQRGNGAGAENGIINLPYTSFLKDEVDQVNVRTIDLGTINGVPYAFTDACPAGPGRAWFLAVAEAGGSTYLDGEVMGSKLGMIDLDSLAMKTVSLRLESKPEGLSYDPQAARLYLCTDDDDRKVCSSIYSLDVGHWV